MSLPSRITSEIIEDAAAHPEKYSAADLAILAAAARLFAVVIERRSTAGIYWPGPTSSE